MRRWPSMQPSPTRRNARVERSLASALSLSITRLTTRTPPGSALRVADPPRLLRKRQKVPARPPTLTTFGGGARAASRDEAWGSAGDDDRGAGHSDGVGWSRQRDRLGSTEVLSGPGTQCAAADPRERHLHPRSGAAGMQPTDDRGGHGRASGRTRSGLVVGTDSVGIAASNCGSVCSRPTGGESTEPGGGGGSGDSEDEKSSHDGPDDRAPNERRPNEDRPDRSASAAVCTGVPTESAQPVHDGTIRPISHPLEIFGTNSFSTIQSSSNGAGRTTQPTGVGRAQNFSVADAKALERHSGRVLFGTRRRCCSAPFVPRARRPNTRSRPSRIP